jgi:hypothetical protein
MVRKGYEGIIVGLAMFGVSMTLIAVIKLVLG